MRWAGQPWQKYGERTSVVFGRENSSNEGCSYIGIKDDGLPG
jgi:hypothetical protein